MVSHRANPLTDRTPCDTPTASSCTTSWVSMRHMHVQPMAVIIVQTSATCLTPAQQMHMMQNGNRGALTASNLSLSSGPANPCEETCRFDDQLQLKRRWCGCSTELCGISPSSPIPVAATQLQLVSHLFANKTTCTCLDTPHVASYYYLRPQLTCGMSRPHSLFNEEMVRSDHCQPLTVLIRRENP